MINQQRVRTVLSHPSTSVVGTVLAMNVVRSFSSAGLTRLLTASDYGVVGIITSVTYIMAMLADMGFMAFVVRHQQAADQRMLDEVWTIRLLRSCALTAALMLLAYPYSLYIGEPEIALALMVWSLGQIIDGLTSMAFAQAVRQGLVPRLSWMEFFVNVTQVGVTIALATWLHSYWAIVFSFLLSGMLKLVLSYKLFPDSRRRFVLSGERAKEIWRFSRSIAASSITTMLQTQTDKVVLPRVLSLETFGFYSIAGILALAPQGVVMPFSNRVLFPAYVEHFRAKGMDGLASVFYGKRRLIGMAYMAGIGVLIGAAPLIVAIIYDPRYASVADYLRIVALGSAVMLNNFSTEQVMVAMGEPVRQFHMKLARFGWLIVGGLAGYFALGPIGIVFAVGTMEYAAMVLAWVLLRQKRLLRVREELMGLGLFAVTAAVAHLASREILALGIF